MTDYSENDNVHTINRVRTLRFQRRSAISVDMKLIFSRVQATYLFLAKLNRL
jgi:hypothetical protein